MFVVANCSAVHRREVGKLICPPALEKASPEWSFCANANSSKSHSHTCTECTPILLFSLLPAPGTAVVGSDDDDNGEVVVVVAAAAAAAVAAAAAAGVAGGGGVANAAGDSAAH